MYTFKDIWNSVCEHCRKQVSDVAYRMWFEPIRPIELKNNEAVLAVQSDMHRNVIEQTYAAGISDAFEAVIGFRVNLKLICEDSDQQTGGVVAAETAEYSYTFDTYIVGASNRFAHAASLAVAENKSIIYNPLFIYGNSGVGKTHLMFAIYNRVKEKYPNKKLLYMRTEEFTNELIRSLNEGRMVEFRERFRTVDMLMLDDIQFIAGKESTQEEFFNTFNTLYLAGKQIVVTSDRPPKDIKSLDDRIRSRFDSGLLADIAPPEFETRVGIIKRKAQMLNINLDDDIVYFIADQVKQNIRQLEGVVKKLQAMIIFDGVRINNSNVQNVINNIRYSSEREPITVERVVNEVAHTFSLTPDDIYSNKQSASISKGRQIAMYICRELIPGISLEELGNSFGKKHTTVIYSINQVKEKYIDRGTREKEIIQDIIKNFDSENM